MLHRVARQSWRCDTTTAMPASQPPEDPRVRFAAERTLLAWIRTGLAMMGFGFVVARFGLFLHELSAMGLLLAALLAALGVALVGYLLQM